MKELCFLWGVKKYAVIVAGGAGTRMENAVPKQFLLLKGKPVLWYTLDAFLRAFDDMEIILVLPAAHIKKGERIAGMFEGTGKILLTTGGETRFQSVKEGLKLVKEESVVFVHDGVRCLISVPLIKRCWSQALEVGSAVPAVAATDSIRIMDGEKHFVENRQRVRVIQTPQTFLSSIILPAFEQEYKKEFTDEATVVEAFGKEIFLTEGEYDNIKITRPVDLMIAERMIEERSAF
jgi:2-C-methyl-D-erythritol 4-phosphate cytidylyltransferase